MNPQALSGIKVIELGQLIAGPFAAKTLADFGADVIKIGPLGEGDPLRKWRLLHNGASVWWQVQLRNEESVALDLRQAQGREIVRRLIAEAEVLIENFKLGTLEKWGMPYAIAVGRPLLLAISGNRLRVDVELPISSPRSPFQPQTRRRSRRVQRQ